MAHAAEEGGRAVHQVLVRLPKEEHEAMKSFAGLTGISLNEAIVRAVREFLADKGRQEEFDTLLARAKSQYKVALDKLKDL